MVISAVFSATAVDPRKFSMLGIASLPGNVRMLWGREAFPAHPIKGPDGFDM